MTETSLPVYLTAQQVADRLGVADKTVLRAFGSGALKGHRLNSRLLRFTPEQVREWIEGSK